MVRVFALVIGAFVIMTGAMTSRADVPPPYDPYGVGARLDEAEPFPQLAEVQAGGPAALAGLKNGDRVIAINGSYSKNGRVPFYFFARGMRGPKDSVVELFILRDQERVFMVKIKRTVPLR